MTLTVTAIALARTPSPLYTLCTFAVFGGGHTQTANATTKVAAFVVIAFTTMCHSS